MSNLSSKFALCGVFTVALLGLAQNTSFSKGDVSVADNASTLSLSTDTAALGFADGSAKSVETAADDSTSVASGDETTAQYSSTPCTVCRKRYYSQGTYYYMNYPAYQRCIEEPCS